MSKKESFFINNVYPHYKDIFRYIYSIVWDSDLSEDLTQEVMIRAWKNYEYLQTQSSDIKRTLLFYAGESVAEYFRRSKKAAHVESLLYDLPGRDDDIVNRLIRDASYETLFNALDRLDEYHAAVVTMFYLQDLSIAEIAAVMGKQPKEIASVKRAGLRKLAKEIDTTGSILRENKKYGWRDVFTMYSFIFRRPAA